jgi:hypothetical protein
MVCPIDERPAALTAVTADKVLEEYAIAAFSDIGDFFDLSGDKPKLRPADKIPERARRAIESIKVRRYTEGRGEAAREIEIVEFRLWNKLAALKKLGEHLGLWGERDVAADNVRVNITVEDVLEAKRRVAECRRAIGAPPLITSILDEQVQDQPP